MVVVVTPTITAPLNQRAAEGWQGEYFSLVSGVHLFMGSVVSWASTTSELDTDAQAQPPDREAGETECSFATEGSAVVHADGGRQAFALEDAGHGMSHGQVALIGQQADVQQVTALGLADGEGIMTHPIASAEVALEVDGPDLVNATWQREAWMRNWWTPTCATRAWFDAA